MKIQCPNCSYTRDMADDRIPAGVLTARCPQCGQTFRFSRDEATADADAAAQDRPAAVRLASLRDGGTAAGAPAQDKPQDEPATVRKSGKYLDVPKGAVVHERDENLFARPTARHKPVLNEPDTQDARGAQDAHDAHGAHGAQPSAAPQEPRPQAHMHEERAEEMHWDHQPARDAHDDSEEHSEAEEGWSFNPWECARSLQEFVSALYQTCLRVMFAPQRFFAGIVPRSALLALSFFLIISALQTVIEHIWGMVFVSTVLTDTTDPELRQLGELLSVRGNFLFWLVLRCVMLCLQLYIYTAILYLCWRLLARNHADFSVILQVLCYAQAPLILCIIPGVGTIAGMFWSFVCALIGCRAALRLSWAQTVVGAAPLCLLILFSYMKFMSALV